MDGLKKSGLKFRQNKKKLKSNVFIVKIQSHKLAEPNICQKNSRPEIGARKKWLGDVILFGILL